MFLSIFVYFFKKIILDKYLYNHMYTNDSKSVLWKTLWKMLKSMLKSPLFSAKNGVENSFWGKKVQVFITLHIVFNNFKCYPFDINFCVNCYFLL